MRTISPTVLDARDDGTVPEALNATSQEAHLWSPDPSAELTLSQPKTEAE